MTAPSLLDPQEHTGEQEVQSAYATSVSQLLEGIRSYPSRSSPRRGPYVPVAELSNYSPARHIFGPLHATATTVTAVLKVGDRLRFSSLLPTIFAMMSVVCLTLTAATIEASKVVFAPALGFATLVFAVLSIVSLSVGRVRRRRVHRLASARTGLLAAWLLSHRYRGHKAA